MREYYDGVDVLLSVEEHFQLWEMAGIDIVADYDSWDEQITFSDLVENMLFVQLAPDNSWLDGSSEKPLIRLRCERCKKPADTKDEHLPECICGTHYCSRECHKQDYLSHKGACDTVIEEYEIGTLLTQYYWKKKLSENTKGLNIFQLPRVLTLSQFFV